MKHVIYGAILSAAR